MDILYFLVLTINRFIIYKVPSFDIYISIDMVHEGQTAIKILLQTETQLGVMVKPFSVSHKVLNFYNIQSRI